jgi:hypothetical protein
MWLKPLRDARALLILRTLLDETARVILIGQRDGDEKNAGLDEARVINAAAVLSAGTGICPQLA